MTTRDLLRSLVPPLVVRALRRSAYDGLRFTGEFGDWSEALVQSTGYSDGAILQRVIEASRRVVAGEAAYERDSVVFDEPATLFHVVAGILRSAALDAGRARVIDVGGSLGSTYRRCRPFLSSLHELEWHVVEQPSFVEAGRAEFATSDLEFHAAIDDVPQGATPATFLLSAVLQYVEEPDKMLRSLTTMPSRHLILDRTPVSAQSSDRLCIQRAPKAVYEATYPCWIFSREQLIRRLSEHWALVSEDPGFDGQHRATDGLALDFRTFILERRRID